MGLKKELQQCIRICDATKKTNKSKFKSLYPYFLKIITSCSKFFKSVIKSYDNNWGNINIHWAFPVWCGCGYWESVKGSLLQNLPISNIRKHTMTATSPPEWGGANYLEVPLFKLNLAGVWVTTARPLREQITSVNSWNGQDIIPLKKQWSEEIVKIQKSNDGGTIHTLIWLTDVRPSGLFPDPERFLPTFSLLPPLPLVSLVAEI